MPQYLDKCYERLVLRAKNNLCRALILLSFNSIVSGAAANESAVNPRFDVWEYQIEGNTSIDALSIEKAVYPYLGPDKTIDDVQQARAALEEAYREHGFATVLVDIPEQDVEEGLVTLQITEGQVERLKITGSRYFSLGRIRHQVPSLAPGKIPHLPNVQKELAELNSLSKDRTITPVLRPGKTPGKLEVELKVDDELPIHGSIEINDRFTRDTERLRLDASLRYDNLWQREHSASISYQVAPENPSNVQIFSGTYVFKIPSTAWTMAFYGVGTNSDVATIGTLGVVGSGRIFGARATRSLAHHDGYFHGLTLGIDYKDFDESIELIGADSLTTPISYHKLSAEYSGTYLGATGTTRFGVGMHWAFRGLTNDESEFEDKRFKSRPNFMYFSANIERLQNLPLAFQLFARLSGQVTKEPLISNEQFSLGGYDTVRGYLESQVFVDDGVNTVFELRSPVFSLFKLAKQNKLRLISFVDTGFGRIQEPLPGQAESFFIWSTGLGMTANLFDGINANLYWAYPLSDNGTLEAGDSRLHFSAAYQF